MGIFRVLHVNANGSFTYTLLSNDLTGPANDGANTAANADNFTVTITDADGNTSTDTIHVSIIDDIPTAHADSNSTTSGHLLTVNAAAGVESNDVFGADGKSGLGVVGVRVASGDTTTAVLTGTGTEIGRAH